MRIVPIKSFPDDRRGTLAAGRVYDVDEERGKRFVRLGLARVASPDEYDTTVIVETPTAGRPSPAVGEAQLSSASPAAQASPQTTAKKFVPGVKKRVSKKRGA